MTWGVLVLVMHSRPKIAHCTSEHNVCQLRRSWHKYKNISMKKKFCIGSNEMKKCDLKTCWTCCETSFSSPPLDVVLSASEASLSVNSGTYCCWRRNFDETTFTLQSGGVHSEWCCPPPLSSFQAAGVFTLLRGGEKQGVSLLYYITCIHAYRALMCVIVWNFSFF